MHFENDGQGLRYEFAVFLGMSFFLTFGRL